MKMHEIPESINVRDESLIFEIMEAVAIHRCVDQSMFGSSAIMDEYHDIGLDEWWDGLIDRDDPRLVYGNHEPIYLDRATVVANIEENIGYYVTSHTHGDYEVDPDCETCERVDEVRYHNELRETPWPERERRLREYLDQFVDFEYTLNEPDLRKDNAYYHVIYRDGVNIGSVQFGWEDGEECISVPIVTESVDSGLFNAQQRFFGHKTYQEITRA